MHERLVYIVALLLFGTAWGATVTLAQVAVSSGHSPIAITAWEVLYGAVLLALVCAARRSWPPVSRRWVAIYVAIAVLGTLVPNSFSYLAAFHLPGGVIALVIATAPMLTLLLAVAIRADRFTRANVAGLLLGLTGVALLVLPGEALPDPAKTVFVFVALVACAAYAVETNMVARFVPPSADPVAVLLGAFLAGLAIAVPLVLATGTGTLAHAPWNVARFAGPEWALVALAALHVLAYGGYLWLVGASGPVFASQIGTVVTASGVLLSVWFLQERPSPYVWASLLAMLAGLALVRPRRTNTLPANASTTPAAAAKVHS